MRYIYFDTDHKKVITFTREISKEGFIRLNAEQEAFFKANRRASYDEIRNAQKYVPPVPEPAPEPTLEELKSEKLKELSELSLEVLGWHVSEYQLMNARLSLEAEAGDKIYDDGKSAAVVETYLRIGKLCRTAYYEAKAEIEACECATDLNDVYERWKEYYNGIE